MAVDGPGTTNDGRPDAWYAVWTKSHCERLVADQLTGKGFTAFLPEMAVRTKRRGVNAVARLPMFPGYLFVRDAMDKASYVQILNVRGAVRILEDGWSRLTPVADAEIDALQKVAASELPLSPFAQLQHGERVRVEQGPLAGVEGLYIEDKPSRGRLVLTVALLGRSVAVEVDAADVTSCE